MGTGVEVTAQVAGSEVLAMEVESLVDRLESDLQDGIVSVELASRLHELRERAERIFA